MRASPPGLQSSLTQSSLMVWSLTQPSPTAAARSTPADRTRPAGATGGPAGARGRDEAPPFAPTWAHSRTGRWAQARTHTRSLARAQARTRTRTYARAQGHARARARAQTNARPPARGHALSRAHTHSRAYARDDKSTRPRAGESWAPGGRRADDLVTDALVGEDLAADDCIGRRRGRAFGPPPPSRGDAAAARRPIPPAAVVLGAVAADAVVADAVITGAVITGAVTDDAVIADAVITDAVITDARPSPTQSPRVQSSPPRSSSPPVAPGGRARRCGAAWGAPPAPTATVAAIKPVSPMRSPMQSPIQCSHQCSHRGRARRIIAPRGAAAITDYKSSLIWSSLSDRPGIIIYGRRSLPTWCLAGAVPGVVEHHEAPPLRAGERQQRLGGRRGLRQ